MDDPESPPKELIELMREAHEVERFENFKTAPANDLHPGFRQRTLYDDQRAIFTPPPSKLLDLTLSEITLHSDLVADLKYNHQECGWDDVLNCITTAKASYDDKGNRNRARAWSRNANATADCLKSLAEMIPDEKGLSVLRQGLVIIFQAWQTRIKNKEEILRQLEDLPVLLSTATETWKLYPRDEKLKNAVQIVYETVLSSINELIRILLRTHGGSFISKNVHRIPAVELQHIDEISNAVARAKTALEACVNRLEPERLARIYETSTSTLSEARATRQAIHGHHDIMMRAMAEIASSQTESRLQVGEAMRQIFRECFREYLASNMQTGLYRLVEETEYCQRLGYRSNLELPESTDASKVLISKEDLLQNLNLAGLGSVAMDIERIRQQETNVASQGRELAQKIMTMTQFTDWVTRDDSRLLLVDGHCKNLGNGKTSPLSVLCVSLASTLAQAEALVILQYYCGQHGLDSGGLPAGPVGLIQSLLAQLLRKPNSVLPEILQVHKELYDRVRPDDVDSLCELFGVIFSQVDQTKITICIIDEIPEFEGEGYGWNDGMSLIAVQLRWMVHNFQGPQRLKVLMTSANKSVVVSQLLEEDDKISFRGNGLPNHSPRRLVTNTGFPFP